jgi:two-component system LytT family response regulator
MESFSQSATVQEFTAPVRVTLAERDSISSQLMRSVLQQEPDVALDHVDDGALLTSIRARQPDIVILDIHTPAIRHASSWESLGVAPPPATIVTTYDASSVSEFAARATDLLEKPFDAEVFRDALLRAKSRIVRPQPRFQQLMQDKSLPSLHQHPSRLAVEAGDKIVLLRMADIHWLQASANQVQVHTADRSHVVRQSLTKLQAVLDPNRFLRVHRNAVVNLDQVEEFHLPTSGNMFVKLRSGFCLPLRRSSRAMLRKRLISTHL